MPQLASISKREDLRNIAIIAHVDHGKTTLVDSMIKQSGAFRANQAIASMDSYFQERERGITILAKNAAIMYKGIKINLVDTPGHADFGGEVERIMNMVDGVLLVVDCVEGPKPQTRFVLRKALEKGVTAIVVVNKIDRPQAQPHIVVDKVFDLFSQLNATDEQLDFKIIYASGIQGTAGLEPDKLEPNLQPLFDQIIALPPAEVDASLPLQLLVANIDHDSFKGKFGVGRIMQGSLAGGQDVLYGKPNDQNVYKKGKVGEVFTYNNVGREKVNSAKAGDIVVFSGIGDITIGDTVMDLVSPTPLPPIKIEEPTVRMLLTVNKSPLAGRDGDKLQSRAIRDRVMRELDRNVALKVTENEKLESFEICGRGQLHLTVFIEAMRREGYEVMIGPPTVIDKMIDGEKHEPFEQLDVSVPSEYSSNVIDILNRRRADMLLFTPAETQDSYAILKFLVPTRGMIGLRSDLLTATRGTVIMDSIFDSYRLKTGVLQSKEQGSLLAFEDGIATTYGINNAQERGKMFIEPKCEVYRGMIVGIHQRPGDLYVNVCKTKQLTNMRAAGSDEAMRLTPPIEVNLDYAVEYIQEDELIEVTPNFIRMLKNPNYKPERKKKV